MKLMFQLFMLYEIYLWLIDACYMIPNFVAKQTSLADCLVVLWSGGFTNCSVDLQHLFKKLLPM